MDSLEQSHGRFTISSPMALIPAAAEAHVGFLTSAVRLALLLLLCSAFSPLKAQVSTSSILGYVYDPSGALVAGADISISDASHSVLRTTKSNASGAYVVAELVPAIYTVSATAPGFGDVTQADVTLAVVDGHHLVAVNELDNVGEQRDFAASHHGEADSFLSQLFVEAPHRPAQVVGADEIVEVH